MKLSTAFFCARGLKIIGLGFVAAFYALLPGSEIRPSWFMEHPVMSLNLFVLPFWLGATTQRLLLAHLHRPSALALPHVWRVSLRLQLPFAVLTSTCFAVISIRLGGGVPFGVAFFTALLAFSASLPSTKFMSWHGSRPLAVAIITVPFLAVFTSPQVLHVSVAYPVLSTIGMLATVVGLYAITFSRMALRARALTPNIDALPRAQRNIEATQMRQRSLALSTGKAAPWQRLPVVSNVRSVCRVLAYEHFRGYRPWWRQLALVFGVPLVVFIAFGLGVWLTSGEHDGFPFVQLDQVVALVIWGDGTETWFTLFSGLFVGFAATFGAQFYPQFARRTHYPFSRRLLAAAIVRFNTEYTLRWFGTLALTLTVFAVATAAARAPAADAFHVPPVFASLLVAIPITGFLLVLRAAMPGRTPTFGRFVMLLVTAIAMWVPTPAVFFAGVLFSPLGLFLVAVTSVVSWLSYRAIIYRHYDVADLDQHEIGVELQAN